MSGSNPLAVALGQVGQSNPLQFASGYADLATKAQALKTGQFNLQQAQQGLAYDAMRRLAMTNPNPSMDDVTAALGGATRMGGYSDAIVSNITSAVARGGKLPDIVRSYATGGMSPENQVQFGMGTPVSVDTGAGTAFGVRGGALSGTPGAFTRGNFVGSTLSPGQATDMVPVGQNPDGSVKMVPRWQVQGSGAPGVSGPGSVGAPATGVGAPSGTAPAGSGGAGVPPSQATYNYGNIRAPGGGFRTYDTPQAGIADMTGLLGRYGDGGTNTLNAITAKWAPAGDGNNNPAAYAAAISRLTGLDPNQPLDLHDPATLAKLIPAMAQIEHGRPMGVGGEVLTAGITAGLGGRSGGAQGGPFIGAASAQPVVSGGAVAPPVGGAVRPAGGVTDYDAYGRPIPQGGAGQGGMPPGGYGGYTTLPAGTTESLTAAAKASTDQYSADNAAAGQFQQRVWPLVQAANILATNAPTTGQGAEAVRSVIGHLQTLGNIFSGGEITNIGQSKFEELGKYMQQAVNASPFAASSNDKLAAAITGSPNTHMTNLANQDVLKAMIGLERMKQMAITDFNNQGGQPKDWTNFLRQWQTSHDPRAFIFDMLPADKRQQLVQSMKSPAERTNFANTLTLVENNPGVMIRPSMPQ